ncbi:MAG: hypothetical protein HY400_06690 [Elusimicrobia bacterium]|nr:hypothetical protein [Elusimicrobiota bacterium]
MILFLGILLGISCFFRPIQNSDLYWHLSAAKYMLSQGAVPRTDFLSHTMQGKPWVDFEWLTQLIYHGIYSVCGFPGLLALRVLLFCGLIGILWKLLRLYRVEGTGSGLAILLLSISLIPSADVRPENFSLLFFYMLLYKLETCRLRLWKPNSRHWILVLLGFCLWSNLHAGFLYGLVLMGFYGLGSREEMRKLRWLAGSFLAGMSGALLNPYGLRIYQAILQHQRDLPQLQKYISEWNPASFENPWQWPYWVLLFVCFLVTLIHYIRTRHTPLPYILAILFWGLSSANYSRHTAFFCLLAIPYTSSMLLKLNLKIGEKIDSKMVTRFLFLVFFIPYLSIFVWPFLIKDRIQETRFIPLGAVEFLREQAPVLKGKRLYHTWGQGGYIGFRLYPLYKVFLDGRYIFHPLLEETLQARAQPQKWLAFMDKYEIGIALLQRSSQDFSVFEVALKNGGKRTLKRPFYLTYMPKKDWALVYWDEKDMIFVRRSSVDGKWLARHEYTYVRPDDSEALSYMISEKLVPADAVQRESARYRTKRPNPSREGGGGF